jgi:large subunit ribosomal protein L22
MKTAAKPESGKSVRVNGRSMRISHKSSVIVCGAISGLSLEKGRRLLEGLVTGRQSLGGKYYTNVAGELLRMLNQGEANAEFKGLDTSRLFVHASANKGFTFWRPRRFKLRRRQRKMTNINMMLEQR